MNDPFIPSGREFDEGLDRRTRRGRIKRLVSKARQRERTKPLRVRELQVIVPPEVGQREMPRRASSNAPSSAPTTTADEKPRLDPDSSSHKEMSMAEDGNPIPVIFSLSSSLAIDPEVLVAIICAYGDLGQEETRDSLSEWTADGGTPRSLQSIVGWLLHATASKGGLKRRLSTVDNLPESVSRVLRYISRLESGDKLGEYARLLAEKRDAEAALARLRRASRGYPTLQPLVSALTRGVHEDIEASKRAISFYSAAWAQNAADIAAATRACRDAGSGALSLPTLEVDLEWNLPQGGTDVALAVLSRLDDRPVFRRAARTSFAKLQKALETQGSRETEQRLRDLGVPSRAVSESQPTRKVRMTGGGAIKRSSSREEPVNPPPARRPRKPAALENPAPASTKSARRTRTRSAGSMSARQCPQCGYYSKFSGAVCDHCASK